MDDGRAVQTGSGTAYTTAMPALPPYDPRFNAAEFERIARAGAFMDARLELREGKIVKMSPAYVPHGTVHASLFLALAQAMRDSAIGLKALIEVTVDLGEYFQPRPDIVVWDEQALESRPAGPVPGPAVRLVIEVADTSLADDLGGKLIAYAHAGVGEYWVADVAKGRLLLHAAPNGDTYERRETRAFGEVVKALTLPLSIDTSELSQDSTETEHS